MYFDRSRKTEDFKTADRKKSLGVCVQVESLPFVRACLCASVPGRDTFRVKIHVFAVNRTENGCDFGNGGILWVATVIFFPNRTYHSIGHLRRRL